VSPEVDDVLVSGEASLSRLPMLLGQSVLGFSRITGRLRGYQASSELHGSAGSPRSRTWKLRVPVARFEDFRAEVLKFGVPQRDRVDSEDITERYYDLAERLKNRKRAEETLRGYLEDKKAVSKLEDILKVESELIRVREEIEVQEGQLRRWANLSALATLSVTMEEVKDYVPPQAPTFGRRVLTTFTDSLDLLLRFGRWVVLAVVALAPWLAVLALVGIPTWKLARRYRRQPAPRPEPPVPEVPVVQPPGAGPGSGG
jgi:hypothetical protein